MPKKNNIKNQVMEKIKKGEIKMRPRWYFILGSITIFIGLLSATIFSILSINLILFLLKKHYGPMYQYRLSFILANFPWWLIIPSILGIILGLKLLKEYRFSYKNNFLFILISYILIIFLSAFLIDKFNLNSFFYQKKFFKKFLYKQDFYQQRNFKKGPPWLKR